MDLRALAPLGDDQRLDAILDFIPAKPGALGNELPFVVVHRHPGCLVDEVHQVVTVEHRQALARVEDKGDTRLSELRGVFVEGNQLFRQANELSPQNPVAAEDLYRRAALRFERLVNEGGVQNGKLFYNIGNAYFRTNDIGRAILNYRKAGQYIPNDLNLQQNLNHARLTRLDGFEETQEAKVLRTLLFWHYDFSTRLRSILFAVFSLVFWAAVSAGLFRPDWAPKWLPAVSGVAGALFLGSLLAEAYEKAGEVTGVVVSQQVIAHKGDSESYEPSFKDPLHAGTEFRVMENRGDWHQIELPDGRQCWIPSRNAGLVDSPL